MTGFARAEGVALDGAMTWVWELRCVNGKGLDVRLRLPSGFEALEPKVRQAAADRLARGNLSAGLSTTYAAGAGGYQVNEAYLDSLIELAGEKAQQLPATVGQASLDGLMAVKGVVDLSDPTAKTDDERAAQTQALLSGFAMAVESLVKAREEEGEHLHALVSQQLADMETLAEAAASSAAAQPEALKKRLKEQVETLLDTSPALPEDRLTQEVALLATKADVREELDRLTAHIAQGRSLLATGGPCGRRLEFLSQELNREANTLCSKSTDAALTKIGLDLKAVIDQFREQIQNVE